MFFGLCTVEPTIDVCRPLNTRQRKTEDCFKYCKPSIISRMFPTYILGLYTLEFG